MDGMARLTLLAVVLVTCGGAWLWIAERREPEPAAAPEPAPVALELASSPDALPQPPAVFAAPERLIPLTVLKPAATGSLEGDSSILAQYSQQDSAAAAFPTDPIWTLPSPAKESAQEAPPTASDLRKPAPPVQHLPPANVPQQQPLPAAAPRTAMQAVADQARAMSERADRMAQKGMLFSARNELVQSLALVAQALDVQRGTSTHAAALAAGLTALAEAEDFRTAPGRGGMIDVAEIARGHQTQLVQASGLSPVVAQQQYYSFAQEQLTWAVAGEPAASRALFTLGKIQLAMAGEQADQQSLHAPRAMVLYQAALATDSGNYLAANELGVLLARFGQLQDARRALLHSVSIQPHAAGWHNLAIVHQRLGESELARLAENERRLLGQKSAGSPAGGIEWVDPRTFAAQSPPPSQRR
jgi:tetratricopeptide (TPR) repeat protein